MSEPTELEQALERLLNRTLSALPLRRAPLTLESRVLDELARRAALPWWRRGFAHWPHSARRGFVLTCIALVGLAFAGEDRAVGGFLRSLQDSAMPSFARTRQCVAIVSATAELAASLARAVPSQWLYAGLAIGAVLYTSLFGLAIAAYRTLYVSPRTGAGRAAHDR